MRFIKLVVLSLVGVGYAAIGPVADLVIENADIQPDGFPRGTVLAGGTFPGPLITSRKGEFFDLNVINELTDSDQLTETSIHWHGIFQKGTAWADGPAWVTQCPISTGHSFTYKFCPGHQAGTFWYHSHVRTQYCDGLRGPLVIYDPHDPHRQHYDVDDETTVITLADWYHLKARFMDHMGDQDSTLINGIGRYKGGTPVDLAVISVQPGMRYRFRLVSISCDPSFTFSIDNHRLTIIEADGISTMPLVVDSIQIFPGQRYSFVLEANQPVDNYWIRANPNHGPQGFDGGINSAILRYVGAPPAEPSAPTAIVPPTMPLRETDLRPLFSNGVPGPKSPDGADVSLNLALSFDMTLDRFLINNVSFTLPSVPVLLQILSGKRRAQDLLPQGSVYPLPLGKVIQISIPGDVDGGPHPFHLHGHAFHVIRSAGSDKYNFIDPVQRDVVSIGNKGDNVTIRFKTDNPGPWFLHCHMDFDLDAGLAIVLAEDTEEIGSANHVPQEWKDLCSIYENEH